MANMIINVCVPHIHDISNPAPNATTSPPVLLRVLTISHRLCIFSVVFIIYATAD